MVFLAVLALIVIGPKQLPELARTLGRFINELKRSSDVLTEEIKNSKNKLVAEIKEEKKPNPEQPDNSNKTDKSENSNT